MRFLLIFFYAATLWALPDPAEQYRQEGKKALRVNQPYDAAALFEKSLELDPGQPDLLRFLAHHYNYRRQFARAADFFDRYFARARGNVEDWLAYVHTLGSLQQRAQARQFLAGRQSPAQVETLAGCQQLARENHNQDALLCLESVTESQLTEPAFWQLRLKLQLLLEQNDKALVTARLLYDIFGDQSDFIWPLVFAGLADKKEESLQLLAEILQQNPQDSLALSLAAREASRLGKDDEAARYRQLLADHLRGKQR